MDQAMGARMADCLHLRASLRYLRWLQYQSMFLTLQWIHSIPVYVLIFCQCLCYSIYTAVGVDEKRKRSAVLEIVVDQHVLSCVASVIG